MQQTYTKSADLLAFVPHVLRLVVQGNTEGNLLNNVLRRALRNKAPC